MSTAVARRWIKLTLKGFAVLLVVLASGLVPSGAAQAADLEFPILFVPIWTQNEPVPGAFTDTRIIIMNPSKHCPVGLDPGCVSPWSLLPADTEVEMFFFDEDEELIATPSRLLTPFDVEVVTGPEIPNGTGTAILVNTLRTFGTNLPPTIALFHPLAAVVEIGVKFAAGAIADPVGTQLFALSASEAQFIPAVAGEFPRIELTAGPGGAGILFGPGWETVIAETCLLEGVLQNFVFDVTEKFLYNNLIICTGLDSGGLSGPDLVLWTPDDGGLLTNPPNPSPPALGKFTEGYNQAAISVETSGGFFGLTLFHGQAFVIAPIPGGLAQGRQAYSYNMPANFFRLLLDPSVAVAQTASGVGVATAGVTLAADALMTQGICRSLGEIGILALFEVEGIGKICDKNPPTEEE